VRAIHSRSLTIFPSRKQGSPTTLPVNAPLTRSSSVAMRCSMPNRSAIGLVMKSLVAVMMTRVSPLRRW
jgi:hypothetical protein